MLQFLMQTALGAGANAYRRAMRSAGFLAAAGVVLFLALVFAALAFNAWLQLHLPVWQAMAVTALVLAVIGGVLVSVASSRARRPPPAPRPAEQPLANMTLGDLGRQMSTGQFLLLSALVGFILGRNR